MMADDALIEYLSRTTSPEILEKAMRQTNLVQQKKLATRKDGSQYMTTVWVKPGADAKEEKPKMVMTDEKHKTASGKYTAERGRLHKRIKDDIISKCAKPKAGERPQAILMGGGSASGKSTMKNGVMAPQLEKDGIQAGTIDSDNIKEQLPEYAQYQEIDVNEAARFVHNESSEIGNYVINTAIDEGRHFIYDGTMKSEDKYKKLIDRLEEAGYDVHIYVADVPLEVAKARSQARAERTGRKVPESIIESSHRGVPKSMEALKDRVKSYQVYDNSGEELELIAANGFVNPEKYSAFLNKGGVKFRATPDN